MGKERDDFIKMRVPESIKEELFITAREEDRSLSQQIRHVLKKWVQGKSENRKDH